MSLSAQNAGFTLIELMIVIVILAIFVTVGVPNFQNMIRENRLATQANELVSSLHFARSESIKRRQQVTVCRTADGAACVAGGAPSWETGWLVFVDDVTANGVIDAGELVLRSVGANPTGTLRSTDANTNDTVRYNNKGLLVGATGRFSLCDANTADTNSARNIAINVTGQVVTNIGSTLVANCP